MSFNFPRYSNVQICKESDLWRETGWKALRGDCFDEEDISVVRCFKQSHLAKVEKLRKEGKMCTDSSTWTRSLRLVTWSRMNCLRLLCCSKVTICSGMKVVCNF